jgi:putative aldouronate transport system permease protein
MNSVQKQGFDLWKWLIYLFLTLTAVICLFPFVHVVAKSFSSDAFVIANRVFLWPMGFTAEAYSKIFADSSLLRSLYVSVIITVLFTILGIFLTVCAAYPLSRQQLKGRKVLTFILMFTMYFTGGIIPDYMLISGLGMLDTWGALIFPLAFTAYNFLIMKNSLQNNIPVSLEESAILDGAGHIRILWSIVIPLSKPIIATLSLFFAVGRWNSYQDALFYIKQRVDLRPLQLKLYYLIVQASESFQLEATQVTTSNPEVLKASCIVFATVPILFIYPFIQRYFVQGVMIGAVKE